MISSGRLSSTLSSCISAVLLLSLCCFSCTPLPVRTQPPQSSVGEPCAVTEKDAIPKSHDLSQEQLPARPNPATPEPIVTSYVPEYRMGPGDVIELVYQVLHEKSSEDYRIEIEDRISINFPYHPQFTTTVLVRPDGKISAPLLGDIEAESQTPAELAQTLNRKYRGILTNPNVTVALETFNVKLEELKRTITSYQMGQSRVATITPDGRISCPLIGNLPAEGLTISLLEKAVNEKYSTITHNLRATLIMKEIHNPKFYILGEVRKPGVYEMRSPLSLLDALTMAEGFKKSASLKEVIVFRNEGAERPMTFKVDLAAVLKQGEVGFNQMVRPADIIYIPKTRLDDLDDLLEKIFTKGFYTIIPVNAFALSPSL
ncbi:MAG: polysaccharide biosynthesis/export family protein [Syntrophobacteraceae bacterium]